MVIRVTYIMRSEVDSIDWLQVRRGDELFSFFCTTPYLEKTSSLVPAKLIYATVKPFEVGNIKKERNGKSWYKVIHKRINNSKQTIHDKQIQKFAHNHGFLPAQGFFSNLNLIDLKEVENKIEPPRLVEIYPEDPKDDTIRELCDFYRVKKKEIRLTGSPALFEEDYQKLHDLDIVIPVSSISQLEHIANSFIPEFGNKIKLKDRFWPLRWRNKYGQIICPFFIYDGLSIPVKKIQKTSRRLNSKIKITDVKHSIFNTPLYKTDNSISHLMFHSTFMRGLIKKGDTFHIDCPIYKVVEGNLKGTEIGAINKQPIDLNTNSIICE